MSVSFAVRRFDLHPLDTGVPVVAGQFGRKDSLAGSALRCCWFIPVAKASDVPTAPTLASPEQATLDTVDLPKPSLSLVTQTIHCLSKFSKPQRGPKNHHRGALLGYAWVLYDSDFVDSISALQNHVLADALEVNAQAMLVASRASAA